MATRQAKHPEICARVFEFLKQKNISDAQLARDMEVSQQGISSVRHCRNDPGYDLLIYLASLGADLNWVLTGESRAAPPGGGAEPAQLRAVREEWDALEADEQAAIYDVVRAARRRREKGRRSS